VFRLAPCILLVLHTLTTNKRIAQKQETAPYLILFYFFKTPKRISRFIPTNHVVINMTENTWTFSTIGETDFYLAPEVEDATHLLIINSNAPSNLPALLGIELGCVEKDESRVGFVTSKHVLTKPHRILNENNPMWPLFKYKNTLILMVNAPPTISTQLGAHRNEWLFNYPPARDIVMRFADLKRVGTLTTYALNRLFTKPSPMPKECVAVREHELGEKETTETLQSIWSWLPVALRQITGKKGSLYIMPSEETHTGADLKSKTVVEPAKFDEICNLLRADGYKIPRGAAKRAQDSYIGLSSDALERIKELIGAHHEENLNDTGAMFQ